MPDREDIPVDSVGVVMVTLVLSARVSAQVSEDGGALAGVARASSDSAGQAKEALREPTLRAAARWPPR